MEIHRNKERLNNKHREFAKVYKYKKKKSISHPL